MQQLNNSSYLHVDNNNNKTLLFSLMNLNKLGNFLSGGSNIVSNDQNKSLLTLMKLDYSYPDPEDDDFQSKIYKKREFYSNKLPSREAITEYADIKAYRQKECGEETFQLQTQQAFLSSFINPDTNYKGCLVFHGTGTGKTCSAYAMAESFKDIAKEKGTKIYVLVSGRFVKEQWKDELVTKCAKDVYLKDYNSSIGYLDDHERNKAIKIAKNQGAQYYKIMSYRGFQKKVLGQKIIEKVSSQGEKKAKKTFKKTAKGEIDRDIAIDKIDSLSNTIIICDEAHNLTGNEQGESLKKIVQNPNSKNLRVILMTATPMKNLGDDIIELINILRPINSQIERDKVFQGSGHAMEFRDGGDEYLAKMVNGYVSYWRGSNPLIFAEGIEHGEISEGLMFTKVVRCFMSDFQRNAYEKILQFSDDTLDRRSQSVANFVFPGLNAEKTDVEGMSGESGINIIRNQLKANKNLVTSMINEKLFDSKYENHVDLLVDYEKKKTLGGDIFKLENLGIFSTKFKKCLNTINELVVDKRGPGTAFIYSNLVKVGIDLFKEVLLQNGYLEFLENNTQNYDIQENTIDSLTGFTHKHFIDNNMDITHFHPATFIAFTGKTDDVNEEVPEVKMNILKNHFNNMNNKEGKYIKIILGSRVMNEGITLYNVKDVHILDVYYNLGRVQQVIGRAIRRCVHYKITNDQNPYPTVNIYKYVVSFEKGSLFGLSAEEELYKKAEHKFILVKQIERVIKEAAIDCPIHYNGNIFPEEVKKYEKCVKPSEYKKLILEGKKDVLLCPPQCDFQKCDYKCRDSKLNKEYFDEETKSYKKIVRESLDYSTFTTVLKRNEVNYVKGKIKELYKYKYVYVLEELTDQIKKTYSGEKADLFDNYFLHQALHELIPIDENDFNNFKDTILDKYNVPGYLIYRGKYYIFQPFDQNEDVPMWYRSNYQSELANDLTIYNYMKNMSEFNDAMMSNDDNDNNTVKSNINIKANMYDFSNMEYYNAIDEFDYVGIIDKGSSRVKSIVEDTNDIFKIRPKRSKILKKKRGTGIPSLKGAVCNTSKDKNFLIKIAKKIGIENIDRYADDTRITICQIIRNRLLYLEKFSTEKDNNRLVYMIIPANHQVYPFPLNLEDRIKHIINQLQSKISILLTYKQENIKNGIFEGIRDKKLAKYKIILTNKAEELTDFSKILEKSGFVKEQSNWTIYVE